MSSLGDRAANIPQALEQDAKKKLQDQLNLEARIDRLRRARARRGGALEPADTTAAEIEGQQGEVGSQQNAPAALDGAEEQQQLLPSDQDPEDIQVQNHGAGGGRGRNRGRRGRRGGRGRGRGRGRH